MSERDRVPQWLVAVIAYSALLFGLVGFMCGFVPRWDLESPPTAVGHELVPSTPALGLLGLLLVVLGGVLAWVGTRARHGDRVWVLWTALGLMALPLLTTALTMLLIDPSCGLFTAPLVLLGLFGGLHVGATAGRHWEEPGEE